MILYPVTSVMDDTVLINSSSSTILQVFDWVIAHAWISTDPPLYNNNI